MDERLAEISEKDGDADCYDNIGEAMGDIRYLLALIFKREEALRLAKEAVEVLKKLDSMCASLKLND